MAAGNVHDGVHVGGAAGQVDGDDRFGLVGDLCFHGFGIQRVAVRIQIGENRDGVLIDDADDGTHIGHGRGDDLIAGGNTADAERHMNSGGTGGGGGTVRRAVKLRKPGSELLYLIAVPVKEGVLVDGLL